MTYMTSCAIFDEHFKLISFIVYCSFTVSIFKRLLRWFNHRQYQNTYNVYMSLDIETLSSTTVRELQSYPLGSTSGGRLTVYLAWYSAHLRRFMVGTL